MRPLALCLLLAAPAAAEDWQPLDTAGITQALSSRVLQYEDGTLQDLQRRGRGKLGQMVGRG